jgi:tRNA G18 (ribose-2'-O)-methylase SpoU
MFLSEMEPASNEGVDLASKKRRADGKETRPLQKRKWEAKQARRLEQEARQKRRDAWIRDHSHFVSFITEKDVERIKSNGSNGPLGGHLSPYFDIQDVNTLRHTPNSDAAENTNRLFIAEGTETIRLLIQQSVNPRLAALEPIKVKSIFVKPSLLFEPPVDLLKDIENAVVNSAKTNQAPLFQVLIGEEAVLSSVAGFSVSRGALACGVVPKDRDEAWLDNFLQQRFKERNGWLRLLAIDGVCDTTNLGSMVRCASAFGIDAIVLSKDCCDPWYRRAVRVSMGHVFNVPVVRVESLAGKIRQWSNDPLQLTSYAAVIDTDAEIILEQLDRGDVPRSWLCCFGNESSGVSTAVVASCSKRIRIDMVAAVDSLSVPIATGILLHGLKERETKI